jgi:YVTN family beta-propeller protein
MKKEKNMFKKNKFILPALLVFTFIIFNGCKEDTVPTTPASSITYNALFVVNGQINSISVIDISDNQVKQTITLSGIMWPHHINMNAAKTKLAVAIPGMDFSGGHGGHGGDMPGKVIVLDATTGNILVNKNTPRMNHNAIFTPNGSEIWTAMMDTMGMVMVYDANTYNLKDSIMVGMMPTEITFSSDGSMAFVCNSMSDDVTVIDPLNKTVMVTLPVGMMPIGAWTGSNNKMYVDNEMDMTITVLDVASMTAEETVNLGYTPGYAAYNSQMNELWVTNADSGKVVYYHRMGNQWMFMGNIVTGAGAHAIAFTSDGMKAYITNQMANTVSVIDVNTHTKTTDINVGTKPNGVLIKYIN